jgi:hypothetical protein
VPEVVDADAGMTNVLAGPLECPRPVRLGGPVALAATEQQLVGAQTARVPLSRSPTPARPSRPDYFMRSAGRGDVRTVRTATIGPWRRRNQAHKSQCHQGRVPGFEPLLSIRVEA